MALLLVIVTFVAYFPALHAGFVFDDVELIRTNRLVHASDGLHRFWFTTEATEYYPLSWSLLWLEWHLWGSNPMGYHVVNVLLHAANAVLVWIILRRLKIPGAWAVGLMFAIHPVNVATVAWISEQKNTLSMFFLAMTILLYLRFDETNRRRWYGLTLAAFLLALLSKTAVVMLPVVVVGCLWWLRRRVGMRDVICSVPFFVLSFIMGLVNIWFEYHRAMEGHVVRTAGFLARLAAAGWVPWFYLYKALLPANLMVIYPQWEIDPSRLVSYAPGVILIGSLALFWWKRNTWGRALFFGLGYFVVMLFPVLGFFDQPFYRFSLVADHWQYYAIIAPIALVISAVELIGRGLGERGRCWGAAIGTVLLIMLGMSTWRRCCVYANEETFWRDTVAKNPNAWVAHNNLGFELRQSGKLSEAKEHFEEAIRINPDDAMAHYNLGIVLEQNGRREEAILHYQQAVRSRPDYADAHCNLGVALAQQGKVQEAIGHYELALRINPDHTEAHYNLGVAVENVGQAAEAIDHYERALRVNPDYVEARVNLGNALLRMGKIQEAVGQYEQALRIKPDYVEAHSNLGAAFQRMGKLPEAVAQYEQALRSRPDYVEAHFNLGLALEKLGRATEAIEQYKHALELRPDFAPAKNALTRLRAGQ